VIFRVYVNLPEGKSPKKNDLQDSAGTAISPTMARLRNQLNANSWEPTRMEWS
jgi:hypothetical protein